METKKKNMIEKEEVLFAMKNYRISKIHTTEYIQFQQDFINNLSNAGIILTNHFENYLLSIQKRPLELE